MADIVKCECGGTYSAEEHEYCPSCFRVTPGKEVFCPPTEPKAQPASTKAKEVSKPVTSKVKSKPAPKVIESPGMVGLYDVEHKCDPLVEQQGMVAALIHGLSEKELDRICTGITLGYEQKTDWHYTDDHSKIRVCIKTLGDVSIVNSLLPKFEYQCACGMPLSVGPCKVCGKDG